MKMMLKFKKSPSWAACRKTGSIRLRFGSTTQKLGYRKTSLKLKLFTGLRKRISHFLKILNSKQKKLLQSL